VSDEFYVGYAAMPRATARRMRWIAMGLVAAAALIAIALAAVTGPFDPATFDYASARAWQGRIEAAPIPVLVSDTGRFPLVLPGKHGAAAAAAPFDGKPVALRAKRIDRLGTTMLEIEPESIRIQGERGTTAAPPVALGLGTFPGEIVDSKCFLGVMNPGRLEVHRACAKRCIAGGIPPMLYTRDAQGNEIHALLVDQDGAPINERVLDLIAVPVHVRGRLERRDGLHYLYAIEVSRQR
jgi:hypothetical protein